MVISEHLISPYYKKSDGHWRCEKPGKLPCGRQGSKCRIWVHDWRDRVTGPEFPLLVVYCATHKKYFTVYPPGYIPHGRTGISPVEPDGIDKQLEEPDISGLWEGTLFESAVSEAWLSSHGYFGLTSWQTHRRRLRLAGRLLGLSGSSGTGEEVAALLSIPLHEHAARSRLFAQGDVHSQREAVSSLLEKSLHFRSGSCHGTERLWRQMHRAAIRTGICGRGWYTDSLHPLFPLLKQSDKKPDMRNQISTHESTRCTGRSPPL